MKVVGKIRWFDYEKRHGYADSPEQKIWDVLIHQDQVIDFENVKHLLVRGARVEFELQMRARGLQVKVVEDAPALDTGEDKAMKSE